MLSCQEKPWYTRMSYCLLQLSWSIGGANEDKTLFPRVQQCECRCEVVRTTEQWSPDFFSLFSVMPSAFHDGRKQYPRQLAILHRTAWICLGRILSSFPAFLKYFSRFSFTVFFLYWKVCSKASPKICFQPQLCFAYIEWYRIPWQQILVATSLAWFLFAYDKE